jgi:hypothetical protein
MWLFALLFLGVAMAFWGLGSSQSAKRDGRCARLPSAVAGLGIGIVVGLGIAVVGAVP